MWKLREKAAQFPKLKSYIGRYAQNSSQSEIKDSPAVDKDWCKATNEQKKTKNKRRSCRVTFELRADEKAPSRILLQ